MVNESLFGGTFFFANIKENTLGEVALNGQITVRKEVFCFYYYLNIF